MERAGSARFRGKKNDSGGRLTAPETIRENVGHIVNSLAGLGGREAGPSIQDLVEKLREELGGKEYQQAVNAIEADIKRSEDKREIFSPGYDESYGGSGDFLDIIKEFVALSSEAARHITSE